MKHFLSRLLLFLLGLSFLFHIKPFYLLITEKYKLYVAGSEVYYSIKKSKQKKQSRILILGDSVGRQLFNSYNFSYSINSLASNQAIAMVGAISTFKQLFRNRQSSRESLFNSHTSFFYSKFKRSIYF